MDVDKFKQVNDTYGHEKGDTMLKKIANVLTDKCPKGGFVYRYGGDEFIAFFPIDEDSEAEQFRDAVIGQLAKDDISVSIGQAVTDPSSDKVFGDYMKIADDEMYKVKVAKKEKGGFRKR